MIWTVILKDGDSFVVHGSSFDRRAEVEKNLRGRRLTNDAVAGIVQGDHPVETLALPHSPVPKSYGKQIRAALEVPEFSDDEIADKVMEVILSDKKREDVSPTDENGRPFNDPAKW